MSVSISSYERVIKFGQDRYGLTVKFKNECWEMKALGQLLFFNPKFMTGFVTVIGKSVYFPSRQWLEQSQTVGHVLCHELVHIGDEVRIGSLLFKLSYLFPQWLALFALLAFLVGPWALMFLIFLLPLPAPFRAFWELRGYAMTDAVLFQNAHRFTLKSWLLDQFTSGSYYFMWPFSKFLGKEIDKNRDLIKNCQLHVLIPASYDILRIEAGEEVS